MSLPKHLVTVTPFSKILAMTLFITLPFVGVYLGMQYQRALDISRVSPVNNSKSFDHMQITPTNTTQPMASPEVTLQPTATPLSISIVTPNYLPKEYVTAGKTLLTITGSGFKTGASIIIRGPYNSPESSTSNQNTTDMTVQAVHFTSSQQIEGTIPSGLGNGYFKVVVTNPNGDTVTTGPTILRGNDSTER